MPLTLRYKRDELLAATPETIRELAEYVEAFMEDDCLCVVGNEEAVRKQEAIFGETEYLFPSEPLSGSYPSSAAAASSSAYS